MYLAKSAQYHGIPKIRNVFEQGFEKLNGQSFLSFSLRFAVFEQRLGEIDRAR